MTLQEFRAADPSQQFALISDQGTRLCSKDFSEFSVILYQVEGFYAEVFYEKQTGCLQILRVFSSTLLLDPYLEQIDISTLLQN